MKIIIKTWALGKLGGKNCCRRSSNSSNNGTAAATAARTTATSAAAAAAAAAQKQHRAQQQHQLTAATVATITAAQKGCSSRGSSNTTPSLFVWQQHQQQRLAATATSQQHATRYNKCNNNNCLFVIPAHTLSHVRYEACHTHTHTCHITLWGGNRNMATIMRIRHVAKTENKEMAMMAAAAGKTDQKEWPGNCQRCLQFHDSPALLFLFSYLNISFN